MTDKKNKLVVQSLNLLQLLNTNGNDNFNYLIPMYQRNYAWGKSEIETLVKDMIDACQKSSTTPYYLGTLVVFKRDDKRLEVIDGQQRLTTLILLAIYLKHSNDVNNITIESSLTEDSSTKNTTIFKLKDYNQVNISFESRPESERTLEALNDTPLNSQINITDNTDGNINLAFLKGYHTIAEVIKEQFKTDDKASLDLQSFCNFLFNNVKIAQVPVPEKTDLNHYFEVMNNRGEQLEKHEIIKARLLAIFNKEISDEEYKKVAAHLLHTVWEACANMNSYVQYGFDTNSRTAIFSELWDTLVPNNFRELFELFQKTNAEDYKKVKIDSHFNDLDTGLKLDAILFDEKFTLPPDPKASNNGKDKNDDSEIYYSLVNFPNFLLHVLRIMLNTEGKEVDVSLDDKQLLPQFEEYIIGKKVTDSLIRTKQFTYALLKTKFLLDSYVIKRKPLDDKHWSLERIKNKKNKDKNTTSWIKTFESNIDSRMVMLQSAFHVSAPTMNYKHWLNASLYHLYSSYNDKNRCSFTGNKFIDGDNYLNYLEELARAFMLRRYLADEPEDYYKIIYENKCLDSIPLSSSHSLDDLAARSTQVKQLLRFDRISNNFVFSYLDYLIWKNINNLNSPKLESEKKNFKFIFQGSREHFYPQNPINMSNEHHDVIDSVDVHRFGNLCLINHGLNSRVSNHVPSAKKQYFAKEFETNIDSLKLYKMIETLDSNNSNWGINQIIEHEKEMFTLFENALNLNINLKEVDDE